MKHHYPDCQGGPDCRCDERDMEGQDANGSFQSEETSIRVDFDQSVAANLAIEGKKRLVANAAAHLSGTEE